MNTKRLLAASALLSAFAPVTLTRAQPPPWWAERQVIDTTKSPSDYAAANQGQIKSIAAKARDELQARIPGGAGASVAQLVASWSTLENAKDYAVLNLGQLKYLAKPFYDRLAEAGYQGPPLASGQIYPWTSSTADDNDYAAVNIGQVKRVFSFDLGGSTGDSDADSLPDWWEYWHFGSLTQNGSADYDGDGRSNALEYAQSTNPANPDITTPSEPVSFTIASSTPTSIGIRWATAVDTGAGSETGIMGYDIYRGGVKVGATTTTDFTDTGVTAGSSYSYLIKAIDKAGNLVSTTAINPAAPISSTSGSFEVFTPAQ